MNNTHHNKLVIFVIFTLAVLFVGCQSVPQPTQSTSNITISSAQELVLSPQDLIQLGLVTNETNCTIESYQTGEDSPLGQNGMCTYYVNNLSGSQIVIQFYKFADTANLNGSFQYNSGHLQGASGIISLNTFGDQSRFSKNSPDDYGAEFTDTNYTYYHLWFTKNLYMVHVTSKGLTTDKDADKQHILDIGTTILSKFD